MDDIDDVRAWERKAIAGLLALLVTAFGAWAVVVKDSTAEVITEVRAMRNEVTADRLEQAQYRQALERRITIIEQRQAYVIESLRNNHPPEAVVVP